MAKKQNATKFQISKTDECFALVKDKKDKVHICLGSMAVSAKTFDDFKQADEYIATKPYELLINIIGVIIKKHEEYEKQAFENAEKANKDNA